ncbi:hypothetical protein Barb6XT_02862 [Bacteroidales bacterium Barb6XT]|nr:hypothetical protein Barb6XT_02862 [Bacteroidales bacterium Barb6XT]
MYAAGGVAAALSGVASTAASSLVGSTASFLTGSNTLSIGLLYYNFNTRSLENPFGSVQQSIFSALDIAGMVLPAVEGLSNTLTNILTKTLRAGRAKAPNHKSNLSASIAQHSAADDVRTYVTFPELEEYMPGEFARPGDVRKGFIQNGVEYRKLREQVHTTFKNQLDNSAHGWLMKYIEEYYDEGRMQDNYPILLLEFYAMNPDAIRINLTPDLRDFGDVFLKQLNYRFKEIHGKEIVNLHDHNDFVSTFHL